MEYTNNQAPVRPQMPSGTPFWRSKMAFLAFAVLAVLAVGWFLFFREEGIPGANKIETVTLSGTVFSYPRNWQLLQTTPTTTGRFTRAISQTGSSRTAPTSSTRISGWIRRTTNRCTTFNTALIRPAR